MNEQNEQKKTEKRVVTLDNSFETIIEWDKNGDTVLFDTKSFKRLSDAEVVQLTKRTAERYHLSRELFEAEQEAAALGVRELPEFSTELGSATERLRIANQDPSMKYKHVRTDKVEQRLAEGWVFVKDGPERTLNKTAGGLHTIGSKGNEELVLMKMPKSRWELLQKAKHERQRRMEEAADNEGKEALEEAGIPAFGNEKKANFSPSK